MGNYISDGIRASDEWHAYGRKVFEHIMSFAGKQRNQVCNPHITANETIGLADYITYLLEHKEHDDHA